MKWTTMVTATLAALFLAAASASAQVELMSKEAPESMQRPVRTEEAPRETSSTGADSVVVYLDDTGVADWRFTNPRLPQVVSTGTAVTFENRTPDRTFVVTTNLVLSPRVSRRLPSTVPLLVYYALTVRDDRDQPPALQYETIEAYEKRLIDWLKRDRPELDPQLQDVLDLEVALRDRAVKAAAEKEAQARVVAVNGSPGDKVAALEAAQAGYLAARTSLDVANRTVARLRGEDLARQRKILIAALETVREELLGARRKEQDAEARRRLDEDIALVAIATDAVKDQNENTGVVASLRLAFPFVRLDDCTQGAQTTCTASIYVYPNGTDSFPYDVLRNQENPAAPARFNIKFFEEEESPAKQTAYLVAAEQKGLAGAPKSSSTLSAVASFDFLDEPFIDSRKDDLGCPLLCADRPYRGTKKTHLKGSGRIEVVQTFGNLFDGKVSIGFKDGDFGGEDSTLSIKLSQYRFNLYSTPGVTFHYGKFQFAAPSSGIAINETGEGVRIAFHNYAAAYIVKRESNSKAADARDRDNSLAILEASNMSIPHALGKLNPRWKTAPQIPFRTLSLSYLYGNDNKDSDGTLFQAHKYQTYGFQLGFTWPKVVYGSLSGYRSRREAGEKDALCDNLHVCDGRGDVVLLTATHTFQFDETGKPVGNATLTFGRGDGDDRSTPNRDEGYIGENAGFAPDLVFLSSFAGAINAREFGSAPATGDPGLGLGLSNKEYYGLKYVNNQWSLLEALAFFIPKADIRSKATIVTVNHYELSRPLSGRSRFAGRELDVEFNVETPRGVKVVLRGGYYWRGAAVERILLKDAWVASTGISLSL